MRIPRYVLRSLLFAAMIVCSAVTARADSVTFTIGNNPQPLEENVLLNSGTTGTTVFGVTNQTNLQVAFSSTTDILVEPSSGQARVEAVDGLLNNITITIPNGTFEDIILNPFFGKSEWEDKKAPTLDEMIQMFEKWSTELLDKVAAMDDASQPRNAQFLYQGQVVMEKPTVEFLWDFMFDAIHHRGQLSAYIRPIGGKVPSIYGPSADDTGM